MKRLGSIAVGMFLVLSGFAGSSSAQSPPGWHEAHAFQLRFGGFFPSGGGEFWDETEDVFTLDDSDFNDFVVGFSYVRSINNYFEIGFNMEFFEEDVRSEYRRFVDEDGFPIFHDSELAMLPLTVDLRFLLGGRHRIRGPRRVLKPVFYVGGGGGMNYWEYEEVGDFLDFRDDPPVIFFDDFDDDGVALELHLLAGVELPLGRRTNLLFEGRYSWSDDDLEEDFSGLGKLELGGAWAYAGASFRF